MKKLSSRILLTLIAFTLLFSVFQKLRKIEPHRYVV